MDLDIELLALLKCKDGGGGGSSVTVEPLTVTENGTTTAPEGKAYSPVTVNVPQYLGYLTFGNIAYLSVTDPVWDGTMYISDDAEQWTEWDGTRFEPGDAHKIYLRGRGNTKVSSTGYSFTFDAYDNNAGGVICKGNIENLLDAATVARGEHPQMGNFCYESMFRNCTSLTTAPALPATTLVRSCYILMFDGCTSLMTAPVLPATTLATACYENMFSDCAGLTEAPELPALTLAQRCYKNMFSGCTGLTEAPELPALTLAQECYYGMFTVCFSISLPPDLPATNLAVNCYREMFLGCKGLREPPQLPAIMLSSGCYRQMLFNCKKIKVSSTSDEEYATPYRIPTDGNGTTAANAMDNMFGGTGGIFKGTPTINTTYYTSNTVV